MPFTTTADGFRINYQVCGNIQAPHTIIFSHGNGNCLRDWEILGYIAPLASDYQLVLMDALGYGESDKPADPKYYTPEKRAQDVVAVLDTLKIDRCHFFGNSIGGSLGFVLAHLYSGRFLSYTLGSAHPYGSTQNCSNLYSEEFKTMILQKGPEAFVEFVENKLLKKNFPPGVRDNFIRNQPQAIVSANTPAWPDYSAFLKQIKVPVMLFSGEKDPVTQYILKYSNEISDCTVNILKDKDHADAYWQAELIIPLLIKFLEQIK